MSTRANIILTDGYDRLYFYRHSDGYPEGVKPTLDKFCSLLNTTIRDNVGQGAGWLIVIGAIEYQSIPKDIFSGETSYLTKYDAGAKGLADFQPLDWKVGSYEPTTCIHGDIDHLYVVDMATATYKEIPQSKWEEWEPDHKPNYNKYMEAIATIADTIHKLQD